MRTVVLKPLEGPVRQIPFEEAQRMLEAGVIYQPAPKLAASLYIEQEAPVQETPVQKEHVQEAPKEEPQVYHTRDMQAEPRRRRGRPRGSKNKAAGVDAHDA